MKQEHKAISRNGLPVGTTGYSVVQPDGPIRLQLSRNEAPLGPLEWPEWLSSPDRETLWNAERIGRYPDTGELERELGNWLAIDPARIVITSGGDEAIDRFVRFAFRGADPRLLIHAPSFEMFDIHARHAGGTIRTVPWLEGAFPESAYCDALAEGVAVAVCVTPNNPTGARIGTDQLLKIAESCRRHQVPFLLDLAYLEFCGDDGFARLAEEPGVTLLRTFSKAWGLAGLRVGYLVCPDQETASALRARGCPFPVPGLSLQIAGQMLREHPRLPFERGQRFAAIRHRMSNWLAASGAGVFPGEANFLLARFGETGRASTLWQQLAEVGVAVRKYPAGHPLADCLRITCPVDETQLQELFLLAADCPAFRNAGSSAQSLSSGESDV